MKKLRKLVSVATMAMSVTLPALAETTDNAPIGVWATEDQVSRYEFSYCGDGKDLCATLVWIRPDKQKPNFMAEMGKLLLDTAVPKGNSTWAGKIRILGQEGDGTVKRVAPDRVHVQACQYFILCKSIDLVPAITQ